MITNYKLLFILLLFILLFLFASRLLHTHTHTHTHTHITGSQIYYISIIQRNSSQNN